MTLKLCHHRNEYILKKTVHLKCITIFTVFVVFYTYIIKLDSIIYCSILDFYN